MTCVHLRLRVLPGREHLSRRLNMNKESLCACWNKFHSRRFRYRYSPPRCDRCVHLAALPLPAARINKHYYSNFHLRLKMHLKSFRAMEGLERYP